MDADQPLTDAFGETAANGGRGNWAYERLHDAIREGTIEPGQRLMEVEVSKWLGMSRTPVREAMRRLQAEGMLEHAAGGGMSVMVYDLRAISEFYATRESLEGAAAALAAQNAGEFEVRVLQARLDAMRALPPDPRLHARENQLLHEQIYQAAHNRFLLQSLRSLLNFVPLLGRTTYNAPGRIEAALAEHVAIVEAIRIRDPVAAEEAIRQHVRHSHESRILVMSDTITNAMQRRTSRQATPGLTKRAAKPRKPVPTK